MTRSSSVGHRRAGWAASFALGCATLTGGCSTAAPWINPPLADGEAVRYDGLRQIADPARSSDLLVVVSFSGGGSRAATLAHATIAELDRVPLVVDGRTTTLAREIDVVTGVSGGSIAAAHLALHGTPRFLERFGADFLERDFGADLIGSMLAPATLHRLSSSQVGRGNVLADAFDAALFGGATFGTLAELPGRPYLIVGATDLVSGAEFDFAADQFARICTSIDDVPLAFAVAASSAVPLVFTPLTLANHRAECRVRERDAAPRPDHDRTGPRPRLVRADHGRYDEDGVRFIHLVDGGVSDNLGVRRIVDYVAEVGGIEHVLQLLASRDGRVARHVVFVNVGSERRGPSSLDSQQTTAGTLQMIAALADGGVGRASRATELAFDEALGAWQARLATLPPPYADVRFYSVAIGLASIEDEELAGRARAIPTAFSITPADRELLVDVAREGLRRSAEFARLREALADTDGPGNERGLLRDYR